MILTQRAEQTTPEATPPIHCLIVTPRRGVDPRAASLLTDAHALVLTQITRIEWQDLYFVEGEIPETELERLARELLADPVIHACAWRSPAAPGDGLHAGAQQAVETALRPGVTDPVAEPIDRCAAILKIHGYRRAATGRRFAVYGSEKLSQQVLHTLATRLLANPVVQRYELGEIALAGWMLILSMAFLERFPNRVVNLHPALPGSFPGTHAIQRAFDAFRRGEIEGTGVMVHLVPDEGVDDGPVLAQESVPIYFEDPLESLETRIHTVEHRLLVAALAEQITAAAR